MVNSCVVGRQTLIRVKIFITVSLIGFMISAFMAFRRGVVVVKGVDWGQISPKEVESYLKRL